MATKVNKETYGYYKRLYNQHKKYNEEKGYVDVIPFMRNKEEWEVDKQKGLSNSEIIDLDFHEYTKEQAKILQNALKERGINIGYYELRRGHISEEAWKEIQKAYYDLKSSLGDGKQAGREAKAMISHIFFGSE